MAFVPQRQKNSDERNLVKNAGIKLKFFLKQETFLIFSEKVLLIIRKTTLTISLISIWKNQMPEIPFLVINPYRKYLQKYYRIQMKSNQKYY